MTPVETILDYTFDDVSLLKRALTHSSVTKTKNYERLEFLGDRVLGLVIAHELYKRFPKEPEGHLAKRLAMQVQGSHLAEIARDIGLGEHILFSKSEQRAGGADNDNILADVFEAVVGAMYLDGGLLPCEAFLLSLWDKRFGTVNAPPRHPKTIVQEWAQSEGLPLPVYDVIDRDGPDHAPLFTVRVRVETKGDAQAKNKSRQTAEKAAAIAFIEKFGLE